MRPPDTMNGRFFQVNTASKNVAEMAQPQVEKDFQNKG
jgi:hypothetical protein